MATPERGNREVLVMTNWMWGEGKQEARGEP